MDDFKSVIIQYSPSENVDYEKKDIKPHIEQMLEKANGWHVLIKENLSEEGILNKFKDYLKENNLKLEKYDGFIIFINNTTKYISSKELED